jgi:hypothetical protein
MGRAIEITCVVHSAAGLRQLAGGTQDRAVVRRLLAIALILEGHPRETAARLNGMDRQTLATGAPLQRRWRRWPEFALGSGAPAGAE